MIERKVEPEVLPDLKEYIDISRFGTHDRNLIKRAFAFATNAHHAQKRQSGEPYILHPLNVSKMLFDMGFDARVIVSGLLHDTVEDTGMTVKDIQGQFGQEIANLVDGVTKISKIRSENVKQRQAENVRKMLLSMVNDIRVILIKLADKLHNMRTLSYLRKEKAQRIARETLDIYAPLAGRLGMARVKVELEDLALKHLDPDFYYDLKHYVVQRREERERYIDDVKKKLAKEFVRYGIRAEMAGRVKHFYSIYRKMKERHKSFDDIFDLLAIRIITKTVKECYEILGVVHKLWMPVRGRFKDYISVPKTNMYQSLHTTVMLIDGKSLEVQIRTEEMDIIAEEGIAAHWVYKERKKALVGIEKDLKWLKKLKSWKERLDNPYGFMEDVQKDLLEDEIYVFTPMGDVIELPVGSTPIDFAYKIHTEVGNRCIGAKVDGRISPLRKPLHSCQVVEIFTSKNGAPSLEWLDVVKTSRARQKIKGFFSSRDEAKKEEEKQDGRETGFRKKGMKKESVPVDEAKARSIPSPHAEHEIIVDGERNVHLHLAQCCNPHPGDGIVGYITRGKGITVHRTNCPNLKGIKDYEARTIRVEWEEKTKKVYTFDIISRDRSGLLMDISSAFANSNANIVELHLKASYEGLARAEFRVQIKDEQQLKIILADVQAIPDVFSINYRL